MTGTARPLRRLAALEPFLVDDAPPLWLPAAMGIYAVIAAMVVLAGWVANVPRLTDWDANGISMLPNSAACSLLSGLALVLLATGHRRTPVALGAIVAVFGAATLFEHVTGTAAGIDRLLLVRAWGQGATVVPGRMGPPSSVSWTLIGLTVVLCRTTHRFRVLAATTGIIVSAITLFSLVGYMYAAAPLYAIPRLTAIAPETATCIFALGIGLIALVPERGLAAQLGRRDAGGVIARRLFLPVLVLPALIGWLRVIGQDAGYFDFRSGAAARTVTETALLVALVWWIARGLSRTAQARERDQRALREQFEAAQTLQKISTQLVRADNVPALYEQILDAAVSLTHAEFGTLQMVDRERGELRLLGARGFDAETMRATERIPTSEAAASAQAFREERRCIVRDVEQSDFPAGGATRRRWARFGIRAVQSTPLVSRTGAVLGMISTHWTRPHDPSDSELGRLDILARQAADVFERAQAIAALRASEARLAGEADALIFLNELSSRLWQTPTLEQGLDQMLAATLLLLHADRGTLELLDPERKVLHVVAHAGFDPAPPDDAAAGPGVHSTPLVGRDGLAIGVVSAHFASAHTPSDQEQRSLDLYVRHAVAFIERKRAEDALREAERRKNEFLAILAHELRNPLAPVRNAAHYLKLRQIEEPEVRRPVEIIERQVTHMTRLIEDLLDVSRISRGMLELRLERVAVAEVIDAAVEGCRDEMQNHGHELSVVGPDHPVELLADRARLIQAVSNLLANAAKYTPPHGRIELVAATTRDTLTLCVRDNGIGIPPEKLRAIFELFAQVDRSLERQGGLGIGLTLARQLIELHGGTIEAKSDGPGSGSEFVVRIPVAAASAPPAEAPASSLATVGERLRILVADDNPDAVESLALVLRHAGHEIHVAYDGEEATALARVVRPEVALLDIGMPRLNGYDAARRIRADEHGRHVFLVAVTGWGQDEDRRRSAEAGFDAHLVKPVSPETLHQLLAGAVTRQA